MNSVQWFPLTEEQRQGVWNNVTHDEYAILKPIKVNMERREAKVAEMTTTDVRGDGNCLFRAISLWITGNVKLLVTCLATYIVELCMQANKDSTWILGSW